MRLGSRLFVMIALASACGGGEPATTTAEPTPPPTTTTTAPPPPTSAPPSTGAPPTSEVVDAVMEGHFRRALDAHDAIIRGDIEQARDAMHFLATNDETVGVPAELHPLLREFQTEAGHFGEATTLTEAGTVFANTLVRCGNCHTAAHEGPEIAEDPIPEGETPQARMRRHQWASDRMFDGLVTPNPATFREGNEALTSAPLTQAELPTTASQPPEQVLALTTNVRNLGQQAANAPDDATRASIYGRYLATCGACHRLLEGGAPPALQLEGMVHQATPPEAVAPPPSSATH